MNATARLFASGLRPGRPLRALAASGQLGYGIPEAALNAGLAREPHFIGCDMGSVDVGPYYLGAGKLATTETVTKRDLRLVLRAALAAGVPLLIGSAGTSGAAAHVAQTRAFIHEIAREDGLAFRMATIHADMPRPFLHEMVAAGRTRPLGKIAALDAAAIDNATNIVGQMGTEAFIRALQSEPDVILAGRACDTAIFAAIPQALGYAMGPTMHMAKIIECTSICCTPGGRDAILGTLEDESFVLDSMNPIRAATPTSVAAHSLYEQGDPLHVYEPDGMVDFSAAHYEQLDDHRTRVAGATWHPASQKTIKIEGSEWCGERAVLLAGSCDPRVIENAETIIRGVKNTVAEIVSPAPAESYELFFHVYGKGATSLFAIAPPVAEEIFFLGEVIASTMPLARSVASVAKQYLLHHGFPGRLSTGGNIAFPFTPPELPVGPAYRYSIYHLVECDDLASMFPIETESVGTPA